MAAFQEYLEDRNELPLAPSKAAMSTAASGTYITKDVVCRLAFFSGFALWLSNQRTGGQATKPRFSASTALQYTGGVLAHLQELFSSDCFYTTDRVAIEIENGLSVNGQHRNRGESAGGPSDLTWYKALRKNLEKKMQREAMDEGTGANLTRATGRAGVKGLGDHHHKSAHTHIQALQKTREQKQSTAAT